MLAGVGAGPAPTVSAISANRFGAARRELSSSASSACATARQRTVFRLVVVVAVAVGSLVGVSKGAARVLRQPQRRVRTMMRRVHTPRMPEGAPTRAYAHLPP